MKLAVRLIVVALATGLRYALEMVWPGVVVPFATYFPAIDVVGYFGGAIACCECRGPWPSGGPVYVALEGAEGTGKSTQAALLEAMQERRVTVGHETRPLPDRASFV